MYVLGWGAPSNRRRTSKQREKINATSFNQGNTVHKVYLMAEYSHLRGCSLNTVIVRNSRDRISKRMPPYIMGKFRKVYKIRNLACDHDVGM